VSNISDIIQSGIHFGYIPDTEEPLKYNVNVYEYSIMRECRIMCDNHCYCLELRLKNETFNCVSNIFLC
jgi:hypothetical protein